MSHGLRRHRLAWLTAAGWQALLRAPEVHPQALDCLAHAATHDWPLVVTRQPVSGQTHPAPVALGLAAPARWGRRAIGVQVQRPHLRQLGDFPRLDALPALPPACRDLAGALQALGVSARVYGSHGWQHLTGMTCTHAMSDVDLLLPVLHADQADEVCAALTEAAAAGLRLDGELAFDGGGEVAWREWVRARAGHASLVLVKRLHGAALEPVPAAGVTA